MKKKYAVAFLATFFFILAIPIITLAQPATPTADIFGVGDASGDKGTYVVVPVHITNATNGPILGIGFDIAYNKNIINVTDVSKGNLVSNWADPNVNNNFAWGTKITIAGFYAADAIPNGSNGSVVLLNFSAIGSLGDISPMNLSLIELSNPEGIVGTAPARNGTFTVTPSPTPTPTPSNGGGSGGGGGPVPPTTPTPTPTENPPTVEKGLKIISSIEAGKTESVTFEELDVYKISIEVDKNVSNVNVMVEKVAKPEEITDAPGIVYAYYNITATNLTAVNVTAKIEFKVSKSWIADENVEEARIKLNRYDEGWKTCPTAKIDEDNSSVYFVAETHGFSIFAISGEKKVEVAITPTLAPSFTQPSATHTPIPTQTPTSTPAPVPGTPPLFLILIVTAGIVIAGIITVLRR